MKDGETGKVNASLVISMIALFVAISGAATAAKDSGNVAKLPPNSVGTAQLKPGAVKATDIGKSAVISSKIKPDAVTSRALAPNSVVVTALAPDSVTAAAVAAGSIGSGDLLPGSVTEQNLADDSVGGQKIKDDAVGKSKIKEGAVGTEEIDDGAVNSNKIGPRAVSTLKMDAAPGGQVSANNIGLALVGFACYGTVPQFSVVDRNVDGVFDPSQPQRLTAPIDGVYRVAANVTWPLVPGGSRLLMVRHYVGSGPNADQVSSVQSVSTAPAGDGETNQVVSVDFAMEEGDYLTILPLTCGGGPTTVDEVALSMNWSGRIG